MLLDKAIEYAVEKHKGQYRKKTKNIPYVIHVFDVMQRLFFFGIKDEKTLASAILHDVIEDTEATKEDVEREFGKDIANIVQELTVPVEVKEKGFEAKKENLNNLAKTGSYESLLIKFVDRTYNVENFVVDNDKEYAYKYYHQADAVFNSLFDKLKEKEESELISKIAKEKGRIDELFKEEES
jgi:(p)ppGpp synthase/HD superfamily hydrolase